MRIPKIILLAKLWENQANWASLMTRQSSPADRTKANSTWCSQAVSHPSTIQAQRCLTSVIWREPVHSTWYGRWQRVEAMMKVFGCLTFVTESVSQSVRLPAACRQSAAPAKANRTVPLEEVAAAGQKYSDAMLQPKRIHPTQLCWHQHTSQFTSHQRTSGVQQPRVPQLQPLRVSRLEVSLFGKGVKWCLLLSMPWANP